MLFQLDHLLIFICSPSKKIKTQKLLFFALSLFSIPQAKTEILLQSQQPTTNKLISLTLYILIALLVAFLTMNIPKVRNSAPGSKHVPWIRWSSDSASFLVSTWFSGNFSPLHLFFSHFSKWIFALSRQYTRTVAESYTLSYSNNLLLGPSPSKLWIISRK